ncbi:vacuolar import and degradation protein-domain-containing protein [Rhodotorula diobovata]|uniref:Vacuolar import and degradation protein-domain-containing protein n=1 Tax=Rhodotorula diobovata TaxID=5288 RepID=A0A5C5FUA1_9BASI|nr:vacuolar import and degradation protein-domain-containing protein [Rhodotorula diobovata]
MPDAAAFDWTPEADPLLSSEAFAPAPPLLSRGPLHAGSTWAGVQRSGRNSYEVTVKFDTVDMVIGAITGTLEIKGLTPELESLVTFFEGEIVGEVGGPGFRTNNYGATEVDDLKHWRRFPAFTRNRLEHQLVKPGLHLRNAHGRPFVFMRLKEQFVTSHRVEAIHGASYAGFYYCCLDCDPSAFSSETSAHRGISPAPPRASPPPPRTRRTSSNGRPNGDAGLLSQTRPAGPRAPSASPPQPTVNLPAAATAVMRPPPPRRGSSGSFSYAAALRGDGSPTASEAPSLSSPSSSPSASSSSSTPAPSVPTPPAPTDLPTPKHELESAFASLPASDAPAPAVHLPTLWQAIANSPQLPSLAPLHPPPAASPPADEAEWPAPSSPPARPGGPMMRRMSSDVASVLAKTRRGRAGGGAGGRRKSLVEQPAVDEDEGALDDRGLRSWTDATISGVRRLVLSSFSAGQSLTAQRSCAQFYFHHSASPYQELSLRYVSASQGGSSNFGFR